MNEIITIYPFLYPKDHIYYAIPKNFNQVLRLRLVEPNPYWKNTQDVTKKELLLGYSSERNPMLLEKYPLPISWIGIKQPIEPEDIVDDFI